MTSLGNSFVFYSHLESVIMGDVQVTCLNMNISILSQQKLKRSVHQRMDALYVSPSVHLENRNDYDVKIEYMSVQLHREFC